MGVKQTIQITTALLLASLCFCKVTLAQTPNIELVSEIIPLPTEIPTQSHPIIVSSVKNNGASSTFDFEVSLYNSSGGFLQLIQKRCSVYLPSGEVTAVIFNKDNGPANCEVTLSPGSYWIGIKALYTSCNGCGTTGCSSQLLYGNVNPAPVTVTSATCSGVTNITSCTGTIDDGSEPDYWYSNDRDCYWKITPSGGASQITLQFNRFDVESGYDYVRVYDGATVNDPLLLSATGTSTPNDVTATSGSMLVYFETDGLTTGQGWEADYTCQSGGGCTTPNTPSGLSATAVSSTQINLSWNDNSNNEDSFEVEYRQGTGSWLTAGTENTNSQSSSVSGLSASTTYSFRVRACCGSDCSGWSSTATATTNSSQTCQTPNAPTSLSVGSPTTSSLQISWSDNSSVETYHELLWGYSSGNLSNTITIPGSNNESYTHNSLNSNTTYYYKVRACCDNTHCSSLSSIGSGTTSNNQSSINILSEEIYPWQRAGDNIEVTVQASTSDNSNWKVVANHPTDGQIYSSGWFSSGSQHTISFTSNTPSEPNAITYQVISNGNGAPSVSLSGTTEIIQPKWDEENVILYNSPGEEFKIPLKYVPSATSVQVYLCLGETSWLEPDIEPTPSLQQNCFTTAFPNFQLNCDLCQAGADWCQDLSVSSKYFTLNVGSGNNLQTANLGLYSYSIVYHEATGPLTSNWVDCESGLFDLTRIGHLNGSSTNGPPVILLGGSANVEYALSVLPSNVSSESTQAWSITDRLSDNNFNVWYLESSNENSLQHNAYNIGLGIEKILELSGEYEYSIIAHSQAGLEARLLLEDMATPISNHQLFDSSPSEFFEFQSRIPNLNSLTFIGTPHQGITNVSRFNNAGVSTEYIVNNLLQNSNAINYLENSSFNIPSSIKFCNVTAFRICQYHDNAVNIASSSGIPSNYPNVSQFYVQNPGPDLAYQINSALVCTGICCLLSEGTDCSPSPIPTSICGLTCAVLATSYWNNHYHHSILTSNFGLDNENSSCTTPSTILDNIVDLLQSGNVSSTSCPFPTYNQNCSPLEWLYVQALGSYVSNATLSRLNGSDTVNLSVTGLEGLTIVSTGDVSPTSDTILIEANGYHSLLISVNQESVAGNKLKIPMIEDGNSSNGIINPYIELVESYPIDTIQSPQIKIGGINVIDYYYFIRPDSMFIGPFNANTIQTLSLDTGRNDIWAVLAGLSDTVVLNKTIHYWPSDHIDDFAETINVTGSDSLNSSSLYLNGDFHSIITSLPISFYALKGANELGLNRMGILDTTTTIYSGSNINLNSLLRPYSYSNSSDTVIFYLDASMPKYARSMTFLDQNASSNISVRQIETTFPNLNIIPTSRTFVMQNLSQTVTDVKFSAILDQFEFLSYDSIYLLEITNDTVVLKRFFELDVSIDFDSSVQKLSFSPLLIPENNLASYSIIKKQPAIIVPVGTLNLSIGDTLQFPIEWIFEDPDFIDDDMVFQILNSQHLQGWVSNDSLFITTDVSGPNCYSGSATLSIEAIHDNLSVINDIPVVINAFQSAYIEVIDDDCSAEPTGSVTLSGIGGLEPYEYSSGGFSYQSNPSFEQLENGSQYFIVRDANGCTAPITVEVNEAQPNNGLDIITGQPFEYLAAPYSGPFQWYVNGILSPNLTDSVINCNFISETELYVIGTDVNGCQATSNTIMVECLTVGQGEIESQVRLSIKPNPTTDNSTATYFVPFKMDVSIRLLDANGILLNQLITKQEQVGTQSVVIPSTTFSAGVYFIEFEFGNKGITEKLVVQ